MVRWFVSYGVDVNHLWDVRIFRTRGEAMAFCEKITPAPTGTKRAMTLERHSYLKSDLWGDVVDVKKVL